MFLHDDLLACEIFIVRTLALSCRMTYFSILCNLDTYMILLTLINGEYLLHNDYGNGIFSHVLPYKNGQRIPSSIPHRTSKSQILHL